MKGYIAFVTLLSTRAPPHHRRRTGRMGVRSGRRRGLARSSTGGWEELCACRGVGGDARRPWPSHWHTMIAQGRRVGELEPELYFLGVSGQFHDLVHTHHCRDFGPYPVQYRGAAAPTEPNSCAGSCRTAHTMQTNNARGALNSTTCPRFRTISQPSLCDPAHMFILPHAVQTWTLTPFPMDSSLASHYFCSACRISSQMSSLVLGHSIVTLTRTALDTLAESALVRPSRSTNEPVDKFFMERLSRPFPWVAPRACATSTRLTARCGGVWRATAMSLCHRAKHRALRLIAHARLGKRVNLYTPTCRCHH